MASGSFARLLADAVMVLIPMILSLTVHEYAHALAAKKLGDDTGESMGRLTLNPLAHADPFGTVILPLALLLLNGGIGMGRIPFFGWAKPVPYNPNRFTRKLHVRTGTMIVAAAGPVANLLMALLCAGSLSVIAHSGTELSPALQTLLVQMMFTNIALFVFNMIPIYPLDGQKVVAGLLKGNTAIHFEQFNQKFGSMALWVIILVGRDIITYPIRLVSKGVLAAVGLG